MSKFMTVEEAIIDLESSGMEPRSNIEDTEPCIGFATEEKKNDEPMTYTKAMEHLKTLPKDKLVSMWIW